MKKNRLILSGAAVLTSLSTLVFVSPVAQARSQATQITFWFDESGHNQVVMDNLVKKFNATHSDVQVKPVWVAETGSSITPQKLLTAIAGGKSPDATDINSFDVAQFASKGALLDLTPYESANQVSKSQFVPALWTANSYQGKSYALPYDTDVRFLFWNKDMFKKAGLNPNNPPKTIAQIDQDAAKLTIVKGGKIVQAGFVPWGDQGWMPTWTWSFGGNFAGPKGTITSATSQAIKALTWQQSYAKKYGISKLNAFTSAVPTGSTAFIAGKEAMTLSGCWDIATIAQQAPHLNYGIETVPTVDGTGTNWSAGFSMAIPRGSSHPKEAFEFISWLDNNTNMMTWAVQTGHYPPRLALLQQIGKPGHIVVSAVADKIAAEALPKTHSLPASPFAPQWWDDLAQAVSHVTNDTTASPAEALKSIDTQINQQVQQNQ